MRTTQTIYFPLPTKGLSSPTLQGHQYRAASYQILNLLKAAQEGLNNANENWGVDIMIAGCANIEVTGSGTNSRSNFLKFPGTYRLTDSIIINICDNSQPGIPKNAGIHTMYQVDPS
ncbi:hypothetical protein BJ878DRAFT_574624 [Calycina marina]|uniref:Uncharacterized protein n=1 Tax=Calycina marina TaxID=1763456 RepID=A0A9P7Z5I2_9HELO|nr:hypothetical protein BJ878DRAFT_574624 [Calycina marina]